MFRVCAASLVLLLTVAPNTALLCRTWCDGSPATEMCQHDSDVIATTVAATHNCDDTLASPPGINGLSKRTASSDVGLAVATASRILVPAIVAAAVSTPSNARATLPHTPLITVLRI